MFRITLIITTMFCIHCDLTTSTNIDCNYNSNTDFQILGRIYICTINNDPNIVTPESALITSITGTHISSKTNNDVIGFRADSKTIHYFPKGLEKHSKTVKVLYFPTCKLKEIHQYDLMPFPHLVYFYIAGNEIEILEEGLFDYNKNLEVVGFDQNKVIHIDSKVFDSLDKLSYFWSGENSCIDENVAVSKEKVKNAIQLAKNQCINSEFTAFESKLKTLENESKTLNLQAFSAILKSFEDTFINYKFAKFRPLKNKFEELKTFEIENSSTTTPKTAQKPTFNPLANSKNVCLNCCKIDQISTFNEKLKNLDDRLAVSSEETNSKLNAIQKSLDLSMDEKLKEVENRMIEKIEKILDEKFAAINMAIAYFR